MKPFLVKSTTPPRVEIDNGAGAVYVRFQNKAKVAKTVVINDWPHVAIDLDESGSVIGVEALGMNEFTINAVLNRAKVEAPADLLSRARYLPTKQACYTPVAA